MPVGRRKSSSTVLGTTTTLPATVTDPAVVYAVGQAVALVPDPETGLATLMLCGSQTQGHRFYGFLAQPVTPGLPPVVMVGRGSLVTPLVEGGVPLNIDKPVWLAQTPGCVTSTFPCEGWAVQVGSAISATQIVLITDSRTVG